MFDTFTIATEPTVTYGADLVRPGHSVLTVPNGVPLVVPLASTPTVGAYRDRALLDVQSGACVCGTPLAITADGSVDATYAHVITDLVAAGATWLGEPVDTREYRYGLVALAHGACNSRHALATTLAMRAGDIMRRALEYRP